MLVTFRKLSVGSVVSLAKNGVKLLSAHEGCSFYDSVITRKPPTY